MAARWRQLPAPVRAVAVATEDAVSAAGEQDQEAFDAAVALLAGTEGSGLVLGSTVRLLLEARHPDGLDGDDIRQVLTDTVTRAGQWRSDVDPHAVLVLLAGALGIHDQDEQTPPMAAVESARHAVLLLDHLISGGRRPVGDYLTAVFTEIERTETLD